MSTGVGITLIAIGAIANGTCAWSSASTPITTIRTGRTGHCSRSRPPGARIRLSKWPVCAFCAGTGSAA
ncbi:MAG TPA: hypothetical protein VKS82_17220 [Streptosporangiaceae bacterium]|nr:hypothetical protein [Streptosporangiaceae bacterium]